MMNNQPNVLSVNPGSGTLRYKIVTVGSEDVLMSEMIDHITGDEVIEATRQMMGDCKQFPVDAIGFRVVHGGPEHLETTPVTDQLLADLEATKTLAPLHVGVDLEVIRACRQAAPHIPAFAVFDTAFHRTIPEIARRYAVNERLCPGLRRFGFHGMAHQFNYQEYCRLTGTEPESCRIISVHLGGGASACAIREGDSIDTSMGLTPLEGLMMSTRSGDLDPSIVLHLLREGRTVDEVEELLNEHSGLIGVSQISSDIRDLEPAARDGEPRAELALAMYAHRVRKYVGAYLAILEGCDAIVVSGALAENSPSFRKRVLGHLDHLGIAIDDERNARTTPDVPARISEPSSLIEVWMIPTDEELQIAREVAEQLQPHHA